MARSIVLRVIDRLSDGVPEDDPRGRQPRQGSLLMLGLGVIFWVSLVALIFNLAFWLIKSL
jgi:hypothetical protein